MDGLRLRAYCRNSKQIYAWTCSRRRRQGGLIANLNVMNEIQGYRLLREKQL